MKSCQSESPMSFKKQYIPGKDGQPQEIEMKKMFRCKKATEALGFLFSVPEGYCEKCQNIDLINRTILSHMKGLVKKHGSKMQDIPLPPDDSNREIVTCEHYAKWVKDNMTEEDVKEFVLNAARSGQYDNEYIYELVQDMEIDE